MTEREAGAEIMIRLTEQFLELVSIYKEASRNFEHIFLLNKAIGACIKSTGLTFRTFIS
jgi:hypothetical protein